MPERTLGLVGVGNLGFRTIAVVSRSLALFGLGRALGVGKVCNSRGSGEKIQRTRATWAGAVLSHNPWGRH